MSGLLDPGIILGKGRFPFLRFRRAGTPADLFRLRQPLKKLPEREWESGLVWRRDIEPQGQVKPAKVENGDSGTVTGSLFNFPSPITPNPPLTAGLHLPTQFVEPQAPMDTPVPTTSSPAKEKEKERWPLQLYEPLPDIVDALDDASFGTCDRRRVVLGVSAELIAGSSGPPSL